MLQNPTRTDSLAYFYFHMFHFITALKTCAIPTPHPFFLRLERLGAMLSRCQEASPDRQAPGQAPFNPVVEASLNTPPLATTLRALARGAEPTAPSQPARGAALSSPAQAASSRAGLGARHGVTARAWAEPAEPGAQPRGLSTDPEPPRQQPPRGYRFRCSLKSAVSARRASRSWMGAGTVTPDSRDGGILGAAILPLALDRA